MNMRNMAAALTLALGTFGTATMGRQHSRVQHVGVTTAGARQELFQHHGRVTSTNRATMRGTERSGCGPRVNSSAIAKDMSGGRTMFEHRSGVLFPRPLG
jgi:hypothetical protein